MSNRNFVKSSYNIPTDEKEYLRRIAEANTITETEVLRTGIKLLAALGERGVRSEVDIIVPAPGTEDLREGPTYVLPFDLDLSANPYPELQTES
jgi:hypothetical protein